MTQSKEIKISDIIIKKYLPIFNDNKHMHTILTSGRAGTKSSFMGILADFTAISQEGVAVVVMRKFHNKLYKTVYKECIRAIQRLGLSKNQFIIHKSPMEIIYKKTGNVIYFTGSDSIDDTKGIIDEQRNIVLVVLDELTEFFEKGYGEDEIQNIIATFVRGNNERFRMLYLFNPPKNPKAPVNEWVKKMELREDTIHIHTDYRDVPKKWLGEKLIHEAEAMKQIDERMYNWVWLGKAIGLDDLIYYMFDEAKHVQEAKGRYSTFVIGVDYGQMNATTFQPFGIDTENKIMQGLDEYYYSGRDTGKQKSPSDYAKDFRELLDSLYNAYGKRITRVCIDPSARGLAEEIRRLCPEVYFPKVNNDVKLGISRVQKALNYGVLKFSPKQKNLIDEIQNYSYDPKSIEKGNEVPIKVFDHGVDATRYGVMDAWNVLVRMCPSLKADEKIETNYKIGEENGNY